jgi:hypothetical protein
MPLNLKREIFDYPLHAPAGPVTCHPWATA